MKYLYKYPQAAYPYAELVTINRRRTRYELEHELMDTGIFDQDRYFDIFVEYAKETPEDILIRITACNRAPEAATLHLLPTLWFKNTWSWTEKTPKPALKQVGGAAAASVIAVSQRKLGRRFLYCEGDAPLLFTENETNHERIFGTPNRTLERRRPHPQGACLRADQ